MSVHEPAIRYCARCIYPEHHPLGLVIDDEGVCSGCRVHEEKDAIDWTERKQRLVEITDEYRSRQRTVHDCIVPVSGGRDSYFIVHVVKNVLGLRPLLVSYNKHYNTKAGIRNLAYLKSLFGCELVTMTVSPEKVKRITRETLRLRGSMYWHCIAGQTAFPVQMAVKFKIPLVIWGAHQGVDQVGMFSHLDEVEMTRRYRKEHDLMGLEAEDLWAQGQGLSAADIEPYRYPHDKELEAIGVRGIYLNNYLRWDSKAQHERMIELYGYETASQERTFDPYQDVDCFHYSGLHDEIKRLKWGFGKVTDHAVRELRLRRLSRAEALARVVSYEGRPSRNTGLFLEWLGMSEAELWANVEPFRNQNAWRRRAGGPWELTHGLKVCERAGREDVALGVTETCEFKETGPRSAEPDDRYVLVGRGFVDDWTPPGGRGALGGRSHVSGGASAERGVAEGAPC